MKVQRMGILISIVAKLTGGKLVWLQHDSGRCIASIAYADVFGKMFAHAHWLYKIGHCILLEDGRIDSNSESSYLKAWKFA